MTTTTPTAPPRSAVPPARRRIAWLVLAGLGAFFLVTAALFRFVVPGQAVRFPLNEYEVMTLQGSNVSYFSAARLTELSGVTMRATYTVKGDVAASKTTGRSGTAVWASFTAVQDITHHAPFQYTYQRLAFDRRTGVLVNWHGNVVGSDHVQVAGQGFVWPLGTAKHDYRVFDSTLRKPVTFRYVGTATTAGIATYRFTEVVNGQQAGTQTLPGSIIGSNAASVTLPEYYQTVSTYWVDPVTGNPLKISQDQRLTLRDASGVTRLVLFDGKLTTTPASVRTVAAPDKSNLTKIAVFSTFIPIACLVLGVVLVAGSVLLVRRQPGAR